MNRRKNTYDNGNRDYPQAEKKINILALLMVRHIHCNADTYDRVGGRAHGRQA